MASGRYSFLVNYFYYYYSAGLFTIFFFPHFWLLLHAQAENIKFTLEQQMVFFARLVGHFEVPDDINPIKIENFESTMESFGA